ncbi:MAG: beta-lactamase regulating signal transducer with metallopeptidase domain [Verrucomicrobiales bacterium]
MTHFLSPLVPKWEWVIPARAETLDPLPSMAVPVAVAEPMPEFTAIEIVPLPIVKPARSFASWFVLVWSIGAVLLCLRLLFSQAMLWRLRRSSEEVDGGWLAPLSETVEALGLRRSPRLAQSSRVQVPMTWGWFRPIILLPTHDQSLTAEERRFVLEHECLHIRRHDAFWITLAHATLCLHWLNPLAWWGLRRLRLAQEQSCDDSIVISQPENATTYADFLLQTAKRAPSATLFQPLALAMLPKLPSQLKQRLTHILNTDMKRTTNNRNQAGIVLIVATVTVVLASLGWRTETQAHEVSDPDLKVKLDATMLETVTFDGESTDKVLEFIKEYGAQCERGHPVWRSECQVDRSAPRGAKDDDRSSSSCDRVGATKDARNHGTLSHHGNQRIIYAV